MTILAKAKNNGAFYVYKELKSDSDYPVYRLDFERSKSKSKRIKNLLSWAKEGKTADIDSVTIGRMASTTVPGQAYTKKANERVKHLTRGISLLDGHFVRTGDSITHFLVVDGSKPISEQEGQIEFFAGETTKVLEARLMRIRHDLENQLELDRHVNVNAHIKAGNIYIPNNAFEVIPFYGEFVDLLHMRVNDERYDAPFPKLGESAKEMVGDDDHNGSRLCELHEQYQKFMDDVDGIREAVDKNEGFEPSHTPSQVDEFCGSVLNFQNDISLRYAERMRRLLDTMGDDEMPEFELECRELVENGDGTLELESERVKCTTPSEVAGHVEKISEKLEELKGEYAEGKGGISVADYAYRSNHLVKGIRNAVYGYRDVAYSSSREPARERVNSMIRKTRDGEELDGKEAEMKELWDSLGERSDAAKLHWVTEKVLDEGSDARKEFLGWAEEFNDFCVFQDAAGSTAVKVEIQSTSSYDENEFWPYKFDFGNGLEETRLPLILQMSFADKMESGDMEQRAQEALEVLAKNGHLPYGVVFVDSGETSELIRKLISLETAEGFLSSKGYSWDNAAEAIQGVSKFNKYQRSVIEEGLRIRGELDVGGLGLTAEQKELQAKRNEEAMKLYGRPHMQRSKMLRNKSVSNGLVAARRLGQDELLTFYQIMAGGIDEKVPEIVPVAGTVLSGGKDNGKSSADLDRLSGYQSQMEMQEVSYGMGRHFSSTQIPGVMVSGGRKTEDGKVGVFRVTRSVSGGLPTLEFAFEDAERIEELTKGAYASRRAKFSS